jgi:hypothetical protein
MTNPENTGKLFTSIDPIAGIAEWSIYPDGKNIVATCKSRNHKMPSKNVTK